MSTKSIEKAAEELARAAGIPYVNVINFVVTEKQDTLTGDVMESVLDSIRRAEGAPVKPRRVA